MQRIHNYRTREKEILDYWAEKKSMNSIYRDENERTGSTILYSTACPVCDTGYSCKVIKYYIIYIGCAEDSRLCSDCFNL